MLRVGDPAPTFTLPNQNGQPKSLGDFLGSWLVVYFYPKDDTPGCTVEACSFRDGYHELAKAGVTVVGISKDSVKSHHTFHQKFNLTFDILSDPDHLTIEDYGAWQEKSMYGKTYMGTQRMTVLIDPDGVVAHIWPKVTPKAHSMEILKVIPDILT